MLIGLSREFVLDCVIRKGSTGNKPSSLTVPLGHDSPRAQSLEQCRWEGVREGVIVEGYCTLLGNWGLSSPALAVWPGLAGGRCRVAQEPELC